MCYCTVISELSRSSAMFDYLMEVSSKIVDKKMAWSLAVLAIDILSCLWYNPPRLCLRTDLQREE